MIRDFDGENLNGANGQDRLAFKTGLEVGSFSYIDGAAFSASGNSEARFAGVRKVEIDQDGDGGMDVFILVDGLTNAAELTSMDFLWQ